MASSVFVLLKRAPVLSFMLQPEMKVYERQIRLCYFDALLHSSSAPSDKEIRFSKAKMERGEMSWLPKARIISIEFAESSDTFFSFT